MSKHIHIISFDIPYPPIYGGIIDVFYKIKSLHKLGYKITLHCYQYNSKGEQSILNEYCDKVYYYPRKKIYKVFFSMMPYIISSRSSDELLSNLMEDNDTIIFEGLHTCFYLAHPQLKDRNKVVWMHNIEADYYKNLSQADKNFIHKIHFNVESKKLKSFEKYLNTAQTIFSVNQADAEYMEQYCEHSIFIPPFHINEEVTSKPGTGDYILYHGSLDVVENHQAAVFLIKSVFSKMDKKVIIAGKEPKSSLIELIKTHPNVKLRANVTQDEMSDLIENAQCCVLFTFQATGLKHKLINSLYRGRFVIANSKMVMNSGLDLLCRIANTPDEIISTINAIWGQEKSKEKIEERKRVLLESYSNESNAKLMIPYL